MEMKHIAAKDISPVASSDHLGRRSLPKESGRESTLGNLKIIRQNVRKKKEEKPKKQLDGKAKGLWDAAKTKTNQKENKKSMIEVSQPESQKFEGFFENCVPLTDVRSDADWRMKYETLNDSSFKRKFLEILQGNEVSTASANKIEMNSVLASIPNLDEKLLEEFLLKDLNEEFQQMLASRVTLPAWSQKEDVLKAVRDNQVVVMCGETGCGKTTQIGTFLLDEAIETGSGSTFHAICTQPRRLAAISVARRVAEERNETCGDSTSSVGYQIRLERLYLRERGSILFCTTGILVQLLISDPLLENYSHILLDEVMKETY